jgi:hypothetical protein
MPGDGGGGGGAGASCFGGGQGNGLLRLTKLTPAPYVPPPTAKRTIIRPVVIRK